jgi:hypothetical protein
MNQAAGPYRRPGAPATADAPQVSVTTDIESPLDAGSTSLVFNG